ncbi:hypothetical protein [Tautonia rosea]|uniref:hypothetical protein n=1 Tax=Tautonia rosea TaxID=2728037 RepID=UPI0014751592|nr:hypothetical protein [Tautonia rosea]
MKSNSFNQKIRSIDHILGYFSQDVLAVYRNNPDKYEVETDNFEGSIRLCDHFAESIDDDSAQREEWIDVRFGFRTLSDGNLALMVYLPDLLEKSQGHARRWAGFHLDNPTWTTDEDRRFDLWIRRYIEGSWDVDNGPRFHLREVVRTINALATEAVGVPLFAVDVEAVPSFPMAQNNHRYQDAHKDLYGYLIDGLSKECIARIAAHRGITANFSSDRTVKALKKVVTLPDTSPLWNAFKGISVQRGEAAHGVRGAAVRFPAFETFEGDLETTVTGLKELLDDLETLFDLDGKTSLQRQESLNHLPAIAEPSRPNYSICRITQAVGKTIEKVEFGYGERSEDTHLSEVIHLHFTDGSILGIQTGSNVWNVCQDHDGMKPEEFHIDFELRWVEGPQPKPKA